MKDEESIRSGWTFDSVFNYSFFTLILQQQNTLNLSTEQIDKLKKLQSKFRKETLNQNAQLQVAEIELNELQTQDPLDWEKVSVKLKQIEAFRTELRLAYIKTLETGKAVLTPEQQKHLEPFERTALVYPAREFSESSFRQEIQTALQEQFKDQKVVEIETAEAIATRLSNWAKLLGFFVGIPLALLGLVLGFLGIKTSADIEKLIKQIDPLKTQVETLTKEGQSLGNEYQALRTKLKEYQQLEQEVKTLTTRVKELEDQITFKPSAVLTPELKRELEASLAQFQKYFQNLGYKSSTGQVGVDVQADDKIQGQAYYDPARNDIVLAVSMTSDTDVLYREYAHHVLISLVPVRQPVYIEIESGLADYFPCSFTNDPVLAENAAKKVFKIERGYVRKLDNNLKFSELPPNAPYRNRGEIWGGAFWEIRQLLKPDVADRLLFSTWKTMASSENLDDRGERFVRSLLEQANSVEAGKYNDQIRSIFAARGLNL